MANVTISQLPFVATTSASALIPVVQNGITYSTYASSITNSVTSSNATSASYAVSASYLKTYKSYIALANLSGGTFTINELQNDLGVSPTWTNPNNGVLTITATGVFTSSKTVLFSTQINAGSVPYFVIGSLGTTSFVNYNIFSYTGTQSSTPNFSNVPFEIRIYN